MAGRAGTGARQGGWAGLLAMLVVLAVVVLLAGTAMRQYGLAGGAPPRAGPEAKSGEAQGGVAPDLPAGATPAPRDAIDRVRGLGDTVREQAADLDQRIDAQSK